MKNEKIEELENHNKILGGAVIMARQTIESVIFKEKPAVWFKIWFYFIAIVNHEEKKKHEIIFKRGERFIKYEWIMDATGATKHEVKHCICWLKKPHHREQGQFKKLHPMITTRKGIRGFWVKVLKYDKYQDLNNYKDVLSGTRKGMNTGKQKENERNTIINNDKNYKKEKYKKEKNLFFDVVKNNFVDIDLMSKPSWQIYKLTSPAKIDQVLASWYILEARSFASEWEMRADMKADARANRNNFIEIIKHDYPLILEKMKNLKLNSRLDLSNLASALRGIQGVKNSDKERKVGEIKKELNKKFSV